MNLTGWPLLALLGVLSVLGPVLVAIWLARRRTARRRWGRLGTGVLGFLSVVVCQVLVVGLVFAGVNRSYGFYTSWSDLFGVGTKTTGIQVAAVPPGEGRLVALRVHGRASRTTQDVIVWLPPQYDQPAFKHHTFPVVMLLPGYPGSPSSSVQLTRLPSYEIAAVAQHKVEPFVAVVPPITIRPGLDTECVDFPHGPFAESWLTKDVRSAVIKKFRVDKTGKHWAIMGTSTGGYCAANLYMRHRHLFRAAVSLGGYFAPAFGVTADPTLVGQQKALVAANSPILTFEHHPPASVNLLYVTSKTDPESWSGESYADGKKMVQVAQSVPGFAVIYTTGGHHFATWRVALPQVMGWLGPLGI